MVIRLKEENDVLIFSIGVLVCLALPIVAPLLLLSLERLCWTVWGDASLRFEWK